MLDCWIGIGGNLGDSHTAFDAALNELRQQSEIQLTVRSGLYQTHPVGQHAGGTFVNAVFCVSTSLSPLQLLMRLQSIEKGLGRQSTVRWGARPIDLDILFVDQQIIREQNLTVPHPAAWYRRFVIDPLTEVAPYLYHPAIGKTIADLHQRLIARPLIVRCVDPPTWSIVAQSTETRLQSPDIQFIGPESDAVASVGVQLDGDPPPTLGGIPIAKLANTPGEPVQRLIDFVTSVMDEPKRVSDW